jgi:hypothetical protein
VRYEPLVEDQLDAYDDIVREARLIVAARNG